MRDKITEQRKQNWFALADAGRCRLLCCTRTGQESPHVEEHDIMLNDWPEPEHERSMPGGGMTHHEEERERRFAADIVAWLRKNAEVHGIDDLVILAAPRMLAVLSKEPLGSLKGHLEELEGNLMRLEAGRLAEHPTVRGLACAATEP